MKRDAPDRHCNHHHVQHCGAFATVVCRDAAGLEWFACDAHKHESSVPGFNAPVSSTPIEQWFLRLSNLHALRMPSVCVHCGKPQLFDMLYPDCDICICPQLPRKPGPVRPSAFMVTEAVEGASSKPPVRVLDDSSCCDHCGKPEHFNVLCPECEELACSECGRVLCICGPAPDVQS